MKEKTTNKTSLICDLLNEALDYRNGDYKDPCVSMLTNVIDNQNKIIDTLFEIISKMDKKKSKMIFIISYYVLLIIVLNGKMHYMNLGKKVVIMMNLI
ncbi:MAG: hypothetical protein ACLU5J_02935 [Christensenellales bacterium]